MKTLHFVRHGHTQNPDKILYGRLPGYALSEVGREEAALAGTYLRQFPNIVHAVSSPLDRAIETAKIALDGNLELDYTNDDLIECGQVFEGQRFPSAALLRKPSTWRYLWNPYGPSWGESYQDIVTRMNLAARSALGSTDEGEAAVLFSHQVPIWQYRLWIEGRPAAHDPRIRQCATASVTSIDFIAGDPVRVNYWQP